MNGTLLSGFRIWIPDGNGKPLLNGRVCFYDASTGKNAEVWADMALTETLGSVVPVDSNGYLPPIWLSKEHLYKAVVQKRIAKYPEEQWVDQWYINDVGEVLDSKELPWSDVFYVEDIEALRALNPGKDTEEGSTIYVMGVHEGGDAGYPLMFRWDANSEENGLGLAFVEPSNWGKKGRWVQIFSEAEIDVRKFGAIPGRGEPILTNITAALRYAENKAYNPSGKSVVFSPGDYNIEGSVNFHSFDCQTKMMPGCRFVSNQGNVNIYLGANTTVLTETFLVGERINLVFEGNVEYIRPQWFFADNLINQMRLASSKTNNRKGCLVRVFGDVMDGGYSSVVSADFYAPISFETGEKFLAGSTKSAILVFHERFITPTRHAPVFSELPYQIAIYFDSNESVDAGWFGTNTDSAKRSAASKECVIRFPQMTVSDNGVKIEGFKAAYEGTITVPDGVEFFAGHVINNGSLPIFNVIGEGSVHVANDTVKFGWFRCETQIQTFKSALKSADGKILDGEGRAIQHEGTMPRFPFDSRIENLELSLQNGMNFNRLRLDRCGIKTRSIAADSVQIKDCLVGEQGMEITAQNHLDVIGCSFQDQPESVGDFALQINAPRDCTGKIFGNDFGVTNNGHSIKFNPAESDYKRKSKIYVEGNSFSNTFDDQVTSNDSYTFSGVADCSLKSRYHPDGSSSTTDYIYYLDCNINLATDSGWYKTRYFFDSDKIAAEVTLVSIENGEYSVSIPGSKFTVTKPFTKQVLLYNHDSRFFDEGILKGKEIIRLENKYPTVINTDATDMKVRYLVKLKPEEV